MLGSGASATRASPAHFDFLMRSDTRLAETLTLFSTLPTLCRTFVATSAMPACREATSSCLCTRSSSCFGLPPLGDVLDDDDRAEQSPVGTDQPPPAGKYRSRRAIGSDDDQLHVAHLFAGECPRQRPLIAWHRRPAVRQKHLRGDRVGSAALASSVVAPGRPNSFTARGCGSVTRPVVSQASSASGNSAITAASSVWFCISAAAISLRAEMSRTNSTAHSAAARRRGPARW